MLEVSVRQFFDQAVDTLLRRRLTKASDFDNTVNSQNAVRLNSSGPRMGYAFFQGRNAEILGRSTENGGYNAYPAFFQFGYQFETMYLNAGNYQALFEIIPLISGLDQGYFIPSLTVLNGIRHNLNGWEFALGPTFRLIRQAEVYKNAAGEYKIKSDNNVAPAGTKYTRQIDSRGDVQFSTSVVVAIGKTFRSGKLNLPINIYWIPGRLSQQIGITFGFNARKTDRPSNSILMNR
jgi:hypothetical protein